MAYQPVEYVKRLRDRAEALRRTAEICEAETTRYAYLAMAQDYELLADRAAVGDIPEGMN
jgi:hypothetical protein